MEFSEPDLYSLLCMVRAREELSRCDDVNEQPGLRELGSQM